MLTRRLLRSTTSPYTFLRSFTNSTAHQRTPALADVTPDGAPAFDARSKEFREGLKAAQLKKQQQDSQFLTASASHSSPRASASGYTPTAPNVSNASDASSDSAVQRGLGSLSTHRPEEARAASSSQESTKRKGALSSLIYGTKEGQQMDQEIEKSFSQVLARGKYVHSIVFHEVKPDKVDEYVELVGGWYPKMAKMPENKVNLVGSWRTEVGDCDTFGTANSLDLFSETRIGRLTLVAFNHSSHLGISTLPRLPCLSPLNRLPARIPRIRPQAQRSHNGKENIPHARILFLADHSTPISGRRLRTPLVHSAPRKPARMGNALAERSQSKTRSNGGSGGLVCTGWRSEHRTSSLAVCGFGGAEG